jgi:hypothetical protein
LFSSHFLLFNSITSSKHIFSSLLVPDTNQTQTDEFLMKPTRDALTRNVFAFAIHM